MRRRRPFSFVRNSVLLLICLVLALIVRVYVLCPVQVAGTSMAQTLQSGDITLCWRFPSKLQRGDVVECSFPDRSGRYIKRIVGMPGETIAFEDGILYVDGKVIPEPYVSSFTEDFFCKLEQNEYLVLGDNRLESYDSRAKDMGCITRQHISGQIQWIFWPLNRFGPVY